MIGLKFEPIAFKSVVATVGEKKIGTRVVECNLLTRGKGCSASMTFTLEGKNEERGS